MKPFLQNAKQTRLRLLDPLTDTPGYRVIRGNPRPSIRYEFTDMHPGQALGIWRCTEGAFECTEKANELQTVLSGRLRLTGEDGQTIELGPGDSAYTKRGEKVVWDIVEEVTKVFFNAS